MSKKFGIFLVLILCMCLFGMTACKSALQADLISYSSSIGKVINAYNIESKELTSQSESGYSKYIKEKGISNLTSIKKDAENIKIKTTEVKNLNNILINSIGEHIDSLNQLSDAVDKKDSARIDESIKKLKETDKKISDFNTKYNELVQNNKMPELKLKY